MSDAAAALLMPAELLHIALSLVPVPAPFVGGGEFCRGASSFLQVDAARWSAAISRLSNQPSIIASTIEWLIPAQSTQTTVYLCRVDVHCPMKPAQVVFIVVVAALLTVSETMTLASSRRKINQWPNSIAPRRILQKEEKKRKQEQSTPPPTPTDPCKTGPCIEPDNPKTRTPIPTKIPDCPGGECHTFCPGGECGFTPPWKKDGR